MPCQLKLREEIAGRCANIIQSHILLVFSELYALYKTEIKNHQHEQLRHIYQQTQAIIFNDSFRAAQEADKQIGEILKPIQSLYKNCHVCILGRLGQIVMKAWDYVEWDDMKLNSHREFCMSLLTQMEPFVQIWCNRLLKELAKQKCDLSAKITSKVLFAIE